MTKPTPTQKNKDASALWRISGLGMELTASIIGMVLVGWLVDRWAGTSPRWTVILAILGVIGGGYNFARQAVRLQRKAAREAAAGARARRERGELPAPDLFERSTPDEGDHDDFRWPDDFDDPSRPPRD